LYFENNPSTPYLYKGKRTLSFKDKINVLFLDVDSAKICSKRPNAVQENSCFVIDRAQLQHAEDWLITDVGSFENRGSSSRVFTIIDGNIIDSKHVRGSKNKLLALKEGEYLVRKTCITAIRNISIFLEQ
jgi:hypothetical protein